MGSDQAPGPKCRWCGQGIPRETETCPSCGRASAPEDLRAAGDATGPEATSPPPAQRRRPPAPQGWQPRAEWERRRLEEARRRARYQRLGYCEYLILVLKEDQVFGLLLGLMAFQSVASALVAAGAEFWTFPAAWAAFYALMLVGLLTFQPWAHSVLLWVAGFGILMSVVSVFQMLLAPLFVQSSAHLAWVWLSTILQIASLLFLIIVLSERSAYFKGVGERAEPKRARLADFLRRRYWRRALSPADRNTDGEPAAAAEAPPPGATSRPTAPAKPPGGAGAPQEDTGAPLSRDLGEAAGLATVACRWCGRERPDSAETCPHCGRATVEAEELQPLGGARPAPVAPRGQPSARPPTSTREGDDLYRVRPMEPAPGQTGLDVGLIRRILSWENVRVMARDDPLFGALLAALALQAVLTIIGLNVVAILASLALVWGVLTLQRWGYWLALALAGLQFLTDLALLWVALARVSQPDPLGLVYLSGLTALNAFIGLALLLRSDRFS